MHNNKRHVGRSRSEARRLDIFFILNVIVPFALFCRSSALTCLKYNLLSFLYTYRCFYSLIFTLC